MLEHPNILSTRPTVHWEHGRKVLVYVVETDLAVTQEDPSFDEVAFDSLAEAARWQLARGPHFDGLRFERVSLA